MFKYKLTGQVNAPYPDQPYFWVNYPNTVSEDFVLCIKNDKERIHNFEHKSMVKVFFKSHVLLNDDVYTKKDSSSNNLTILLEDIVKVIQIENLS